MKINIVKQLGQFQLSFNLQRHTKAENPDLVMLKGSSGSGKTTLMRCISGLDQPDRGIVTINGKVFYDSNKKINLPPARRKVGYCFQNYLLFPHLTVEENILFGVTKHENQKMGDKWKGMETIQEGLSIPKAMIGVYPHHLSGGEQQRVALARALMRGEELLLLDEPFSALHKTLRNQVFEFILDWICTYNIPAVLVSHIEAKDNNSQGQMIEKVNVHMENGKSWVPDSKEFKTHKMGDKDVG